MMMSRLFQYVEHQGISFRPTGAHKEWEAHSLPRMTGFTPHLLEVQIYGDHYDKTQIDLWAIHDTLHLLFYDFANLTLGPALWSDRNRFFEVHLASELFAVLALDYHCLAYGDQKTITVDMDHTRFKGIQKQVGLPEITSFEFCKALGSLYFSGKSIFPDPKNIKNKDYRNWMGHEIRYSEKQRHYTHLWWENLRAGNSLKSFVLNDSQASYGIWELINQLIYYPDSQWTDFLKSLPKKKKETNFFCHFKKYEKKTNLDFRFTAITSQKPGEVRSLIVEAQNPDAGILFAIWQVFAQLSVSSFNSEELKLIQKCAKNAQTNSISLENWSRLKALASKKLSNLKWRVQKKYLADFFLP